MRKQRRPAAMRTRPPVLLPGAGIRAKGTFEGFGEGALGGRGSQGFLRSVWSCGRSGRAAAGLSVGPGRERRGKCCLQPLGDAPASRVCFTHLRNNSSRRRRTQTVQKDFGVLAKTRTGYCIKLSPKEWLRCGLGHTSPKWEFY